jgi:hypothetical protein
MTTDWSSVPARKYDEKCEHQAVATNKPAFDLHDRTPNN